MMRGRADLFARERDAELKFQNGDIDKAIHFAAAQRICPARAMLQSMVHPGVRPDTTRVARPDANTLQIAAHKRNRALLRPRTGMEFKQIALLSQKRVENIRRWIVGHETGKDLSVAVESVPPRCILASVLSVLESAVDELGRALSLFASGRTATGRKA